MVFLKEFFFKVDFEKSADNKKARKITQHAKNYCKQVHKNHKMWLNNIPEVIFLDSLFDKGQEMVQEIETNCWLPGVMKILKHKRTTIKH